MLLIYLGIHLIMNQTQYTITFFSKQQVPTQEYWTFSDFDAYYGAVFINYCNDLTVLAKNPVEI